MSRGHLVLEHSIDQIQIGHQHRRDLGDLTGLKESITRAGVLSPPAVTEGFVLISGHRRIAAMKELGMRVTPVWVVPGVSDKLSYLLAVHDEQTLQKPLTPIEQAELYAELKTLFEEDALRRKTATQYGSDIKGTGGADSAPPRDASAPSQTKSRVQAARAVTGRDSRTMLEQVSELQRIAAGDEEDPFVRQAAAEALIELNQDGKVNGRYQAVKFRQNHASISKIAEHPDTIDTVRAAANRELTALASASAPAQAVKESGLALGRIQDLQRAATEAAVVGWHDVDPFLREKHEIRKLVDLIRREHGWWNRNNPLEFAQHANAAQWELLVSYLDGAQAFLTQATAARADAHTTAHNSADVKTGEETIEGMVDEAEATTLVA